MIETIDIESMRQQGLQEFRTAIEARIKSGSLPTVDFIKSTLLMAMGPILRAIAGDDAKPEDHIIIHIFQEKTDEGQTLHHTQAEGLTPMGNAAIEGFMDLPPEASA